MNSSGNERSKNVITRINRKANRVSHSHLQLNALRSVFLRAFCFESVHLEKVRHQKNGISLFFFGTCLPNLALDLDPDLAPDAV